MIKTPTADIPEGAIAGYIEQKLPKALSGDDSLQVNLGSRYEQLNNSFDPELSIRAEKTLIEDSLAISGTYATSKQRFRRDTLNFTRYENLTNNRFDDDTEFVNVAAYKAAQGIAPEEGLFYASEVRQFSESADGDRDSYAINIEWQVKDYLKLGLDLLGTEKNLTDNTQDVFILGARGGAGPPKVTPTDGIAPIFGYRVPDEFNPDGTLRKAAHDRYVVTDYSVANAQYFPGNRKTDRLEKTDGVLLTAEWKIDAWTVTAGYATSDAEAKRINAQFDSRYQPITGGNNGITARVRTGNGNQDNYLLDIQGFENLQLNGDFQYDLRDSDDQPHEILSRILTRSNLISGGTNADGSTYNTRILITSNEQFVERGLDTFKLDIEYALETTFINSLKFGAFHSKESYSRNVNQNVAAFANLDGISNDLLKNPEFTSGKKIL